MTGFKDHFSSHAAQYAKYRPSYPETLFDWLAGLPAARDCAWDAGTGNGQAALGLARHFTRVIATDPAQAQIRNAAPHPRVTYRTLPAEQTDIAAASIDLVTVAQAVHWFDFERFYREVARVAKPHGVLVLWTYGLTEVAPEVDMVVRRYYTEIVGPYWPPERKYVDDAYRTIPFPFTEIQAPAFAITERWTMEEFLGYLGTWSASERYAKTHNQNPLELIRAPLRAAWGEPEQRVITWPLYLRVGRMPRR